MKLSKTKQYAVITGDVVGSSKLPPDERKKLLSVLKRSALSAQKASGNAVPEDIVIYRGDSWQLLVTDPSLAVRVGLLLRAAFKAGWGKGKIDTRFAIGVGTIDFIPSGSISGGDGEAFRRSGSALERMKKNNRMYISLSDDTMERTVNVILYLIDTLAIRWTGKQAQAVMGGLQGLTQEKIAKLWKPRIHQQAVNKHLERAGWHSIECAVQYIEKNVKKL